MLESQLDIGDEIFVTVQKVQSPSEFYAIKTEHIDLYTKMTTNINEYYNKLEKPSHLWLLEKGRYCVVRCTEAWNRAEILEDIKGEMVKVRFIDEGSVMDVPYYAIYELEQDFYKCSQASIKCSLYNAEPNPAKGLYWTDEAKQIFKDIVFSKCPTSILIERICSNKKLVTLFVERDGKRLNINLLLRAKGLAHGEGSSKEIVEECIDGLRIKRDVGDLLNASKSPDTKTVQKRESVVIAHVVSPSEFYCKLRKHLSSIQEMERCVQECVYDQDRGVSAEKLLEQQMCCSWKLNEPCLVYASETFITKIWYRGRIVKIGPNDTFDVLLRDKGNTVSAKRTELRKCQDELAAVCDGKIEL